MMRATSISREAYRISWFWARAQRMMRCPLFHHMVWIPIEGTNSKNKQPARNERCELKVSLANRIELADSALTRTECWGVPLFRNGGNFYIGKYAYRPKLARNECFEIQVSLSRLTELSDSELARKAFCGLPFFIIGWGFPSYELIPTINSSHATNDAD